MKFGRFVLVEFYVVGLALKKNQFTGNHTANGQSTIIWPSVLFVFEAFFDLLNDFIVIIVECVRYRSIITTIRFHILQGHIPREKNPRILADFSDERIDLRTAHGLSINRRNMRLWH